MRIPLSIGMHPLVTIVGHAVAAAAGGLDGMVCLIYYWYLILMEEVQYLHLQCITTPHGKDVQYHPLGVAVGPIWYLIPSW